MPQPLYILLNLLFAASVGIIVGLYFWLSSKRKIKQLEEEKLHIEQEKQIVLDFMHNMVEAVGEGLNKTKLYEKIIHSAMLCSGATSACIYEIRDETTLHRVSIEGLFPPQLKSKKNTEQNLSRSQFIESILKKEIIPLGKGVVGEVGQNGIGVFIQDATNNPRIIQHNDPALKLDSLIISPIKIKDRILGVIAIANPAAGTTFTETDFSLMESLAEQSALAIHNADIMNIRLEQNVMEMDLALASNVQRLLLPSLPPQNERLSLDVRYIPTQRVSGDFYEFIPLDENRLGVAIADVSGKGISASLIMAICHTNLRHFSKNCDSPSEIFRLLNKELSQEIRKEMFITLIYGIIDFEKNTLTFARAGHELPILVHKSNSRTNRSVERISSEGMAIGLVPGEIFDEVIVDKTIPFQKDDMLILFTDGITETSNSDDEEYSNERFANFSLKNSQLDAKSFNDQVLKDLDNFAGENNYADDITLITLKRA